MGPVVDSPSTPASQNPRLEPMMPTMMLAMMPHLRVRLHEDAAQPAHDAAHDQRDDPVHALSSLIFVRGRFGTAWEPTGFYSNGRQSGYRTWSNTGTLSGP